MIELITIIALFVTGLHIVSNEGMLLNFYRKFIERIIKSKYWRKPFIDCPPCMVSVYGIPIYLYFRSDRQFTYETIVSMIIVLVCASSLSYVITYFWED